VRSNLDPFGQYSNVELEEALQRVHLVQSPESQNDCATEDDTNVNIFNKLSSTISEGGLNLSQGQRQLLCLARAIISRPKVMVLDEATSAVDMATDALIQRSIREEFTDSTLIVIAHRLSTIADFDKVLVLSEGRVEEFGSPRELLEKKGVFQSMVEDSGERELLERMILGEIQDRSWLIKAESPGLSGKGKARQMQT
jgi:ABC-type multidrug transport system fused ATPase/permease subunit